MLLPTEGETGNQHLLPISDISPEEFNLLCGNMSTVIVDDDVTDEDTDSEWEEMEWHW